MVAMLRSGMSLSDGSEDAVPGPIPTREHNAILQPQDLGSLLKQLKPTDHICLVYETEDEWKSAVIPFIALGLERGEKCVYVADAHTPDQVWATLSEQGIDVEIARSSGRLVILDQSEAYAPDGSFDPGRTIARLIKVTKKALAEGYPALRVTAERSWSLRGQPGSEKLLEFETRLNRELFSQYPVLALCQYDQRKFDPRIIKGAILTHPTLIHGNDLYRNSYYIPPEQYINREYKGPEVKHLLNNLAQEKESQERIRLFAAALESSKEPFAAGLADGTLITWNRAFEEFMEYSGEELKSIVWRRDLSPPSLKMKTLVAAKLEEFQATHQPKWTEAEHTRKDGRGISIELLIDQICDSEGNFKYYFALFRDITERKRAEAALKQSEEKYRELVQSVNSIIIRIDPEARITFINDFGRNFFGYTEAELIGKPIVGTLMPRVDSSGRDLSVLIQNIIAHPEKYPVNENENICSDGQRVWISWTAKAIYDQEGNFKELLGVGVDVTDRKSAGEALLAERECLAVTLRSIGDGVIATNLEGKIALMNQVAEELTGWSQGQVLGKPINEVLEIYDEKTREKCEDLLALVLHSDDQRNFDQFAIIKSKKGPERNICVNGAPIRDKNARTFGMILAFRDITEKKKMMAEIQKAQKLESLGTLAGGIAHDFNNFLMGIVGNISLAKMELEPGTELYETMEEAEKACVRAKDLTQQLLTFAKGGAPIKKVASLKNLIKNSAIFALRGSKSRPEFSVSDQLWQAEVDHNQISQVIHSLVINADQAMPEGGIIQVKAKNVIVGKDDQEVGAPISEGNYVKISVQDQGMGISEENLAKIFDPFFSTKQTGRGLGLATSYSIVKNHQGYITADSRSGAGSVFYFYLPASAQQISEEKPKREKRIPGSGNVLVMDDDASVRSVAGAMLRHLGYQAGFAPDGEEAIQLYAQAKESGKPFDLVIMDLTIPGGMGGKEAIKKLLEIDPGARAIVSSGYSTDPIMSEYQNYGFQGVIVKPYVIEEFSQVLHKAKNSSPDQEEDSLEPKIGSELVALARP